MYLKEFSYLVINLRNQKDIATDDIDINCHTEHG